MMQQIVYTHLPYCIRHLGGDRYILLNRNYKPLGQTSLKNVDYDSHFSVVRMRITKKQAIQLSYNQSDDIENICLYKSTPDVLSDIQEFDSYFNRLKILAKLMRYMDVGLAQCFL